MIRIALVYKTGGDYTAEYVDRLVGDLAVHASAFDVVVLSDDPDVADIPLTEGLPGWWSKIELFRPDIDGDLFYLDLDTIVIADIDGLIDDLWLSGVSRLLTDFNFPNRLESGVMYLTQEQRRLVWREWQRITPRLAMKRSGKFGDGQFLRSLPHVKWRHLEDITGQSILSYKKHCTADGPPPGTKIICYHGKPRPKDTGWSICKS